MNLSLKLGLAITFALTGIAFPPALLAAAVFGLSAACHPRPIPPAHTTPAPHADHDWLSHFHGRCESVAEVAFLDAVISAFSLKPNQNLLTGGGLTLALQVPVENFRLDFLADNRLAVEIDGAAYHTSPAALRRDQRRDARLRKLGFFVLRIPAKIVLGNPPEAIFRLNEARAALGAPPNPPEPDAGQDILDIIRPSRFAGALLDAAASLSNGISTCADHVHREAEKFKERDQLAVQARAAETQRRLREELAAEPELAKIHEALRKELGW